MDTAPSLALWYRGGNRTAGGTSESAMAIRYTCKCGANIRMPTSTSGKKARCQSCGVVFTVPAPGYDPDAQPIPLEGAEPAAAGQPQPPDQPPPEPPGGWLADFARDEKKSGSMSPVMVLDLSPMPGEEEAERKAAAEEKARTTLPRITPRLPHEQTKLHDADRSGVIAPELPFWQDLLQSFTFFLDPSSLVTYLILAICPFVLSWIPVGGIALGIIANLYIAAFYMAIVRETASGEDRLPEVVWMSGPFDLVMPLVHFLGVSVLSMLPPTIYVLASFDGGDFRAFFHHVVQAPSDPRVQGLTALGLLFWPVMILAVAIGGSLRGLWPHRMVWTVLCAPAPYLAVCAVLIIAVMIRYVPHLSVVQAEVARLGKRGVPLYFFARDLIGMYGMIVAMRTIGLYYRHYKHKFPWAAE